MLSILAEATTVYSVINMVMWGEAAVKAVEIYVWAA